ncbi:PAX-interacting protein 1 [Parasteatoda tepidariorum]|uniref:PAX-interacting protein 1 n=1 Tax=Parasteatoda tepidariorum TaxID=114398 RepID=UPI00077FB532|nr:integrator complex subunit 3 homolog [Parasteatoda tepidariorum]
MAENRSSDGKFYEVLYDYSLIDQSYDFTCPENKNIIHSQCPSLVTVPGFCFQGKTQQNKTAYINICHSLELPNCNVYNSKIHTSRGDESILRFNLYLDDERVDRDENGKICICYDTIIQTEFMDSILSHSHRDQRLNYLYQTACKAIYDRYNIKLEKEFELLKKFYHGTMPESLRNVYKRLGVLSKSEEGNNKEPYFSDPFTINTTIRKFHTERKPEFDIKNPSIEYEIRQFPAEGEFKGFMLQVVLPYFSFLDPRDVKVFASRKKLFIRENKTNHQFYFYLPNAISVMDCRIHYHEGKITIYLPRANPSSIFTLGQYRRRPDPPRIISPHEAPRSQTPMQQLRPHHEQNATETTNSQIVAAQISHHQTAPPPQMSPRQQYPPHYKPNYPNIDNHQTNAPHMNQGHAMAPHFPPTSQRSHFQSNTSHMSQHQENIAQMPRHHAVHYQMPPSQNSQHMPSQMNHPQMTSRPNHLQPLPSQMPHNRVNPHYMNRYPPNVQMMERHQGNAPPVNRQQASHHHMGYPQMDSTQMNHHQSTPPRMEHRQNIPPQIAHHQASPAQMNQLQMASSHLAQLQTVLSRQVHLQEAPSLLARLQATLSQVENLKANSIQQADPSQCALQKQDIETEPQKPPLQNTNQEKDSVQNNSMQIADLQAALNEISDLQKALLEAANFQVANLQAAILHITTPQREDSQNLPPTPVEQQITNPETPHSQPTTESDNLQTNFQQSPYPQPASTAVNTPTPASSP